MTAVNSDKRLRGWVEHARERGEPWPRPGPPLPPGWYWLPSAFPLPHRAECEHAPLAIRQSRRATRLRMWIAEVRGSALRLKPGVGPHIVRGRRGKGTRDAVEGSVMTFRTPFEAANAALAYETGARVRPPPSEA